MQPGEFELQDRGPYQFDRWQWRERVPTRLGHLPVELTIALDAPPPDAGMVAAANKLAEFAAANGDLLLDLIYGHYRYAEEGDWLEYWDVPPGLGRDRVLSQVESITLAVRRNAGQYDAGVFVDPRWDPEHKLDLSYSGGQIVAVNGSPFSLVGEILHLR
jgi:hypothetical protein